MCRRLDDGEIGVALGVAKGVKQRRLLAALVGYGVGAGDLVATMGTGGYVTATRGSRDNFIDRLETCGFALVLAPDALGRAATFVVAPCDRRQVSNTQLSGCTISA